MTMLAEYPSKQARDEAHETRDTRERERDRLKRRERATKQRSNDRPTKERRTAPPTHTNPPAHSHQEKESKRVGVLAQASFDRARLYSRERERPTAPRVETHLQSRCCACGRGQRHIVTHGADLLRHTQRRGDPATHRLAITSQCSWTCSWESGEAEAPRARDTQRSRTRARSESSTLPTHRSAIESSSSSIQLA